MKSITLRKINKLTFGLKKTGGRNNYGIITVPRNSLTKQLYRFLDTKRQIFPGVGAKILGTFSSTNRSGYISLLLYPNGVLSYVLSPQMISSQEHIYNLHEPSVRSDKGWSSFLHSLPLGTIIYNIELIPGNGGQLSKAAGNNSLLLKKKKNNVLIKLKSGAQRFVNNNCIAVSGIVSNQNHFLKNLKKAGTSRLLGFRPHVRACSKNPVIIL
jgi:large subunit ribosomal protein L2